MTADFMSGLDPEQIFRIRQDLDHAATVAAGTAPRSITEDLYTQIAQMLYLLELAVRKHHD